MAGENEAVTLLRYRIDNTSVEAAVQSNKRVAASYENLKAATATFSPDVLAANPQLLATQTAITSELQRQLPLAERLAEAARVRASAEQGTVAGLRSDAFGSGGGGGRNVGGSISRISRGLFNLPDVQLTPGISTTVISRLGLVAGGAAEAVGLTATQLGVMTAVAAPLVIGLVAVVNQMQKAEQTAKDYAAAQADVNKLIAGGGTTEELTAARDRALANQQGFQRTEDRGRELLANFQSLAQQLPEGASALDVLLGRTPEYTAQLQAAKQELEAFLGVDIESIGGAGGVAAALDQMGQEADKAGVAVAAANLALDSFATAAADASAANDRLNAQFIQAQIDGIDRLLAVNRLTQEQREEQIGQAQSDLDLIQEQIRAGGHAHEVTAELYKREAELTSQIETLTAATDTYADILEREQAAKEALTERNDAYLDLIDQEIEAREEAYAIQQKILEIEAERDARILEVTQDRDERLLELTEDASERREEIIADANERIARIERDAARDRYAAIANRDALAFAQTEIRAKDALDDQQKALDKSLKQVEKNLEKQEKALEKSYRRQVDNIISASNKQLQVQYNALTQQNFLIQSALAAQAAHVQSGFQLMVGGTAQGMLLMQNIVAVGFMNMVQTAEGIINSFMGGFTPIPRGGGNISGGGGSQRKVVRIAREAARSEVFSYFRAANPVGARV